MSDKYPPELATVGALLHADALALRERGLEVAVLTSADISKKQKSVHDGIPVYRLPRTLASERWRGYVSLYHPRLVRDVGEVLAEFQPDVVHCHNVHQYLSYGILRAAKRSGARVFLTAHDVMLFHYGKLVEFIDSKNPVCKKEWDYRVSNWQQIRRFRFRYNPLRNFFIRRSLKNVDGLFAVSNALRQALEQNGIRGAEVLHNGIDSDVWRVDGAAAAVFRKKFALEGKKVIFFGGRISPLKGAEAMLDILARVVCDVPEATLMIVGKKNTYVESLMTRASERGMEKNVFCTGWLSGGELRAAYGVSAVVAVPSLCFDSLPTVAIEAAAAGIPAIGSPWGGIPEIIAEGETGYIAHPLDTKTFAQKIAWLLRNEDSRVRMSAAARACAAERFSLATRLDRLESDYAASVARRHNSAYKA